MTNKDFTESKRPLFDIRSRRLQMQTIFC